jgi:hypothetical protein
MAVSYIWPLTLPQVVQKGFSESIGINVLRTPMDAGPAKMRARSKRPSVMNVSFLLTTAQVAILESFVLNTIQGVSRFGFPHPRTSAQVEARIVPGQDGQYYSVQYAAPGYWSVALQLEILP